MKISKCDNYLITEQMQARIQFALTVKEERNKKYQKQCHFCYFCNPTLVYLSISQLVYLKK